MGADADTSGRAALADLLEDEEARRALIHELRQRTEHERDGAPVPLSDPLLETHLVEDPPSGQRAEQISLSRRVALLTKSVVEQFASEVTTTLRDTRDAQDRLRTVEWPSVARAALDLLAVAAAVFFLFFGLRRMVRGLYERIDRWSGAPADDASPLLHKFGAVASAAVLDVLVIVVAWILAFLVALFVTGNWAEADQRQTMLLNAFLLVEVFKALVRVIFATRYEHLRLVPMADETAAYWNAWFARMAGFIGYGLLLLVPIINFNVSPAAGGAVTFLIMLVALIYALAIVLQNRDDVRDRLRARAQESSLTFARILLLMLARSWHLLAIAYFIGLVVTAVLHPEAALPFMLKATVQTLVAVAGGIFLALVLAQIISRRITLPDETRARFPMLEARLNGAIPGLLQVVRAVILAIVLLLVLDAWSLFNLPAWLRSETGTQITLTAITVGLILVAVKALWIGVASWIEHRLNPETGSGEASAREKTLLTIFRSAFLIVLITMTVMIVLLEIGINIAPLLAGAGVLGLAIGFGAQKFVQDVITGIFIQLENAIDVGDVVTVGGITGTAEKLSIRSVGIRDLSGTYHIVPFSSVDAVSNFMRGFAYHVGVYGIAYRENTDHAIAHLREAFAELVADEEQAAKILDDLEVHGVTTLGDNAVDIRIRIKTLPGAQWAIGRAFNRLVKLHFDAAGIEIPYPHLTMYFGEDKEGHAPPAQVRLLEDRTASRSSALQPPTAAGAARSNPKHKGDFDED